ncbi:TonB-dependent Receptor Plug Domain protein [Flavobacterium columnare]|uniref:Outer membrane beta-barrel family protein n=3 Tax=Flavobacterium TaxID=237 RepID=A0ABW8PN47_9FLAO|nr:outer membrane beta-barrel family protein [Flavobacterium columnare]SPE77380.1 TonB-dependent Receptor Plug Domain protein [Flavobacterium columnare]
MKRKAILVCLLAAMGTIQAQTPVTPSNNNYNSLYSNTTGSLTGKVIDKKNNSPLPYVSITVKSEGKTISGAITKDNGAFSISSLPLKNLVIEVVFMGYKKYVNTVTLTSENKNINLKNIVLEDESKQLNEVSITKEKSSVEQKIDRKVITIGKDLQTAGATAAELMNNIPTVSVDVQNNTVSLRGNENVRIFIDGKPSNLSAAQALQQIPSTAIKQVELITNPSAKYNPEGMSGIINIVLNKNSNLGFNGNITTAVNFGITPKFNGSIDLNYRFNKFNFYTNYSLNHGKNTNHGLIKWNKYDSTKDYDLNFDIVHFRKNNFSKIGTDFYINDKNTLSFYTIQNFDNPTIEFKNGIHYLDSNLKDLQIQEASGLNKNQTYNLAYKHLFDNENRTLDIELSYNTNDEPENSIFKDRNYTIKSTNTIQKKGSNFIGNIDFVNPINETSKIELGLESRLDDTNNKIQINSTFDALFNFRRNIYSAYSNYSKELGKWNYQLGIRFESYEAKGSFQKTGNTDKTFSDYIFTVYPSAFLTYNLSENNSFNLNYSRRVDRPNMEQVNEIRQWNGLTIQQVGNSKLRPQFTNSIELNYTRKLKIGSITSGAFVRFIQNEIDQIITTNPNEPTKQQLTFTNFDRNTEYGIELSGNLDFRKWWSVNFGFDSYFTNSTGIIEKRDSNLYTQNINAVLFNSRMNHTFKLTKDFRLIWFTMYRAGQNGLQFSNKDMWKTDLGARLNLLNGKGSLSIRYNDIFNKMRARFYSDEPAQINGIFRWESQSININFNYRFGSGKNRALDRKQRSQNESQGGGLF